LFLVSEHWNYFWCYSNFDSYSLNRFISITYYKNT